MNFFRSFSLNTACMFLVFSLGFVNSVLLANQLGREHYGTLKVWTAIVLLGGLLLGEWLNKGNTYIVGRERARDIAVNFSLLYGLILGILLLLSIPFTLKIARILLPGLTFTQWILGVGLIAFTVLQKSGLAILLGEGRLKLYALLPVIFICAYLGGNLFLWWLEHLNLERTMGIWLGAAGATALATFIPLLRAPSRFMWGSRRIPRQMFLIGMRGEVALVSIFLLFKSDVFLINYFMGKEAVGVYAVATLFTEMMQRVPNIASVVLLSWVVRGQDSARLLLRVAQGMFLFSLLTTVGFVFLGHLLLSIFFSQYPDAYTPLIWLLPGMLFASFGSVFNTKLIGDGYPPVTMWAPGISLAINIMLNLWLIPVLGLRGAALSTSITYTLWSLLVTSYCLRQVRIGWRDVLRLQ